MDVHPLLGEDIETSGAMKASTVNNSTMKSFTSSYMGSTRDIFFPTKWWQKIFIGGTMIDAFMMEAAQQVGQSL